MLFEYMMYMAWTICGATTSTTLRRCRLPKGLNHRLHGWRAENALARAWRSWLSTRRRAGPGARGMRERAARP